LLAAQYEVIEAMVSAQSYSQKCLRDLINVSTFVYTARINKWLLYSSFFIETSLFSQVAPLLFGIPFAF
jgi:hypothetical protein